MNTLLEASTIQARVRELAEEIERDYPVDEEIHLVGVLKGGLRVHGGSRPLDDDARVARLHRGLELRRRHEVVRRGSISEGPRHQPRGRHVIIVEDIVDTGLTLKYLQDILRKRAPKSLRTACLLSKPSRRKVEVPVEYIGFTIEDRFVVGYGLDYAEKYRNLPYIAVLDGGWVGLRGSGTLGARGWERSRD